MRYSYGELVENTARISNETIRAIIRNSNDIALFKEEVSQQLRRLRDHVEEDANRNEAAEESC